MNYSKIPLKHPASFHLFLLAMEPVSVVEQSIKALAKNSILLTNIEIVPLRSTDMDRFFEVLDLCNLSEAEQELTSRAQAVISISSNVGNSSKFDSFWQVRKAACLIEQHLDSPCIVIDIEQGNTVSSTTLSLEELSGIPLARDYITIKAYEGENENTYYITSEGMVRFGVPEIALSEIPCNLGADGAYLIRTVAQYLLTKIQHTRKNQDCLRLSSELKIPADYCEYNNPNFHGINECLSPIQLTVEDKEYDQLIMIEPTEEYEEYYDWLMEIIESINEKRTKVHWLEVSQEESKIFV